jgi:SnoaL-like domain
MTNDPKTTALAYIDACSRKDWPAVAELLDERLRFLSPGNAATGAGPYLAILRRIAPVWVRSDVKKVFSDGGEVCVIYDFITDTEAGAVPIVEWLSVEHGKIASVTLIFDRMTFQPASRELARRAEA